MRALKHNLARGLALFVLWITLSGRFSGLFLLLGGASCAIVAWLSARMRLSSQKGAPSMAIGRAFAYAAWLLREIFISNLKVAQLILDPHLRIKPVLFFAPAAQKTDLGRFMFANSITLTPGTISIEIADDGKRILVHALHPGMSWGAEGCEMGARVCALGV